jgi:alpha-amylase
MSKTASILILAVLLLLAACDAVSPAVTPTLPLLTLSPTPIPTVTPHSVQPGAEYTPTPEPEIETPAWFDDAVLYEIFVRSFYDSDGDGIGDLAGIIAQLGYLEQLGITAIWLMPIHPSPSYHGYDVTDYFAINPDYGTMGDMIALVDEAHSRNIRVIIDLVINHMADDHPIFGDAFADPNSEYADWFLWTNETHTTYQAFGGFRDMPELNHDNPEVYDYVAQVARFWMDLDGDGDYTDGVDGFRCDVAKDVPLATWQALRQEMRALDPDSFLLGEVWERNVQNMIQWYNDAFDALFDYPLYHGMASSHDENLDSVLAGVKLPETFNATIVGEDELLPAGYQVVRFVNNHDNNRVMSEVGMDWDRARTAATFYLTLPGTPMIYYGEEIGMPGEKGSGNPYWDEYRREPMDWYAAEEGRGMATWFRPGDRFNAPHDGISVEEHDQVANSLLNHYRALVALRSAHRALRTGAFGKVVVTDGEGVYAYTRHAPPVGDSPEEWFLVILNFSDEARAPTLDLGLAYGGPFAAVDALSGERWPEVAGGEPYSVELDPASGTVLQLNQP